MELYVVRIVMETATQIWYLTVMIHIVYKLGSDHMNILIALCLYILIG